MYSIKGLSITVSFYNKLATSLPGGFKYSSHDPSITFLSLSVHKNIPEKRKGLFGSILAV